MVEDAITKDARIYKDGAAVGLVGGAALATVLTSAILLGSDAVSDPLHDALQGSKIANIQPDQLADEISKDPAKQARWRELREFVAKIDKQVQGNIAQDARNLAHKADNWQERVEPPNLDTSHRPPR